MSAVNEDILIEIEVMIPSTKLTIFIRNSGMTIYSFIYYFCSGRKAVIIMRNNYIGFFLFFQAL